MLRTAFNIALPAATPPAAKHIAIAVEVAPQPNVAIAAGAINIFDATSTGTVTGAAAPPLPTVINIKAAESPIAPMAIAQATLPVAIIR